MEFRETTSQDRAALLALYLKAFPEEDLTALAAELLDRAGDEILSLAAVEEGEMLGHVVFTRCAPQGDGRRGALLGPLLATPERHGQGIGSALVAAGHARLDAEGVAEVLVLGDPDYYGRFGFAQSDRVTAPYPLPADWAPAWQSLRLSDREGLKPGPLDVPEVWRNPVYWGP
ncbi:GNAT family N-acetyltransferase [Dinoroseobacter sp. S76]|uniref:GNAT family N-acetyltransferase n=1 Tax=Dinoroseobacter sp. S76 TaxID=3415124 RepID=UPI003C7C9238